MLKQEFKEDRCKSGIRASLNRRTREMLSSVPLRIICSDPVLAGVPSPEVLCSLGFLGWLGETFHEEMVGGTVCSRWAKTMISKIKCKNTKRILKETSNFYFYTIHFKRRLVGRQVSLLSMFLWFHMGETPRGQKIVVLSALYINK